MTIIAVVIVVSLLNHGAKPSTPLVQAAIQRIKASSTATSVQESIRRHDLPQPQAASSPVANEDIALRDFIALSSFLPNHLIADFTVEQQAKLELLLQQSRKATYQLLVETGKVSRLPNGNIRVEIVANDGRLNEMVDFIHSGMEQIVGAERMKSLREELGPKFEAKFAYFGRYDTTITLSVDQASGAPGAPSLVTMQCEYRRVKILGIPAGFIRSTSVLYKPGFESDFFSIDQVVAKI